MLFGCYEQQAESFCERRLLQLWRQDQTLRKACCRDQPAPHEARHCSPFPESWAQGQAPSILSQALHKTSPDAEEGDDDGHEDDLNTENSELPSDSGEEEAEDEEDSKHTATQAA
eukprot:scaffold254314_cov24-Prasinocladus_malaysianus.AAC.1